jgi:hypothetical protein
MNERMALLEAIVAGGVAPDRLIPGTGLTALPDSVTLCRHAIELGVHSVMVLPPFYYKDVSDDALHGWFAGLIEGVGKPDLKIYIYHIPPVAKVRFSIPLVGWLTQDFPGVVVGIKDSGGDWDNTAAQTAILGKSTPGMSRGRMAPACLRRTGTCRTNLSHFTTSRMKAPCSDRWAAKCGGSISKRPCPLVPVTIPMAERQRVDAERLAMCELGQQF